MTSENVPKHPTPAEEQVAMIEEDFTIKMISNRFSKAIRIAHFSPTDIKAIAEGNITNEMFLAYKNKCHIFYTMLDNILKSSYYHFWSSVIYNVSIIESIFEYMDLINQYPLYGQLIPESNSIEINSHLYRFFYRLIYPNENGDSSLSQAYHDTILNKQFTPFKRFKIFLSFFPIFKQDFGELITDYINRQEDWCRSNFEKCRDNLLNKLKNFLGPQTDLRREFNEIVEELWIVSRLNYFARNNSTLSMVFMHEEFIFSFVKFYHSFMIVYKDYVDSSRTNSHPKTEEATVERFQSCLMALFSKFFQKAILHDLQAALSKSNAELYRSLENFEKNMKFLFTENQQFIVDFLHYCKFEHIFELFYGDELKRIIRPETALLNYKIAFDEAKTKYPFSNLWWSTCDHDCAIAPNLHIDDHVPEIEDMNVDPKNEAKVYEFLSLNNDVLDKIKTIRDFLNCDSLADGYLYLCLEYYGFDSEKTINAILENAMPGELKNYKDDLTFDDVNEMKKAKASQPNSTTKAYIGKKDKVSSVLNQDKGALKDKILGLSDKIAEEEEMMIEEAKRLVERGEDIEELKKNDRYIGLAIYNDECDDTYEEEDISIEKSIEPDDRDNFDRRNQFRVSNNSSAQYNYNHHNNQTLSDRNQWKIELENEDDDHNGDGNNGRRTNFIPNEKFANASQYRKNQFRNKKLFNQRSNNNNNSGDNSQQQQSNNRGPGSNQSKGQNDNSNNGSRKGGQNSQARNNPNANYNSAKGSQNIRGNNGQKGNPNNPKRPNHEAGINPNKRK